ncbi:MAG: ankyrin repeat domain-containing protein [Acidobacteriota bacterium]|jgi:ankyrin repeat protein|nr:ankyrin repeat domain-containing protein [Acidobacteriota bacterium]
MFSKTLSIIFCLSVIFSLSGCEPRADESTPEMTRNMLKLRGYEFNKKEFFRGIRLEDGQVVKAFLQAGSDPNAKNEKGDTALVYAIREKDPKIAEILIEKADINMQDDNGNSPLHTAVLQGKDEIVEFLLEKNADVNVTGAYNKIKNQTPLYQAIIKGRFDLAEKFLKNKADPNIADSEGSFPLAEVVVRTDANPQFIKKLIENGADVNKQEETGSTALLYAASNKSLNPNTRQEIVKLLLENGADKTIKNKNGEDALFWAKKNGNEKVAEMLK